MNNIKIYSICHREFWDTAINNLDGEERKNISCYIVNEKYPKDLSKFSNKIDHIREYDLPHYNEKFQERSYYEYSFIPHVYLNPDIFKNYTHIGMMHSDIVYKTNSVRKIVEELGNNPDQIFYYKLFNGFKWPDGGPLYFSNNQLENICEYMSIKLKMFISPSKILYEGWIGSMAIAPKEIFIKFGKFMEENYEDFHDILFNNRWNIQDTKPNKHRACGFIERLWGFYLISLNKPLKYMDIIHDQDSYTHD